MIFFIFISAQIGGGTSIINLTVDENSELFFFLLWLFGSLAHELIFFSFKSVVINANKRFLVEFKEMIRFYVYLLKLTSYTGNNTLQNAL